MHTRNEFYKDAIPWPEEQTMIDENEKGNDSDYTEKGPTRARWFGVVAMESRLMTRCLATGDDAVESSMWFLGGESTVSQLVSSRIISFVC